MVVVNMLSKKIREFPQAAWTFILLRLLYTANFFWRNSIVFAPRVISSTGRIFNVVCRQPFSITLLAMRMEPIKFAGAIVEIL